jgi:hypothetical protein
MECKVPIPMEKYHVRTAVSIRPPLIPQDRTSEATDGCEDRPVFICTFSSPFAPNYYPRFRYPINWQYGLFLA